jgi:hypothetical protein
MIVVSCSVPGSQRNTIESIMRYGRRGSPVRFHASPSNCCESFARLAPKSSAGFRPRQFHRFATSSSGPPSPTSSISAEILAYFARLIEAQDEAGLAEYANLAVDVTFRNYTGHNLPNVTTIALLDGVSRWEVGLAFGFVVRP